MLLLRPPPPSSSISISFTGAASRTGGIEARTLRYSAHLLRALGTPTPPHGQLTSSSIRFCCRGSSSSYQPRRRWKKLMSTEGLPLVPSPTARSLSRHICHCAGSPAEGDAGGGSKDGGSVIRNVVVRAGEVLSMGFPLWVASACVLALLRPSTFLWVHHKWQIIGLTITMLGMGMTLTLDDLRGALLMPKELLVGFLLQYTEKKELPLGLEVKECCAMSAVHRVLAKIEGGRTASSSSGASGDHIFPFGFFQPLVMPSSGYIVSRLLKLPSYYAAGLILVACCPGGTASNIVTYLANGNVALSVLMTAASTFASVVMTPFLTSKLAGQFVAVDPAGLFMSTVQVVLAPVLLGALLNQYCSNLVAFISPLMPFIAVAAVAILCGSAIAQNASSILTSGLQVVIACCSLHASGFFFGYVLSRLLRLDKSSSRTISIEVGMQNSVLGVVLAGQHFANPLTAVPCAVSSVCHSVYGSVLAGIWRHQPAVDK